MFKYFILILLLSSCVPNKETISTQEYKVTMGKNAVLYLKERFLKKQNSTLKDKVILLLPPLSIPSAQAFDVPHYSLMEDLAKQGYDVFALDFEGEGNSTFPEEVDPPVKPGNDKMGSTSRNLYPLEALEAVNTVHFITEYILKLKNVEKIDLLGWSWGAVVASMATLQYPEQVNKLVVYGMMYNFSLPLLTKPFADEKNEFKKNLPPYQVVPWGAISSHWEMMQKGKKLASEDALKQVENIYNGLDKNSPAPHSLRRPMGPMRDLFYLWTQRPFFQIDQLKNPTLVIYGADDIFADKKLFSLLKNVSTKKEIVIPDATHWVLYEKNRYLLTQGIIDFLNQK